MNDLNNLIERIDEYLGTNNHIKLDPSLLGTKLLKEVQGVLKSLSETTSNRYVYHYCGYVDDNDTKTTIEGLAYLSKKIYDMDDYKNLKQMIALNCLYVNRSETLVITSLSILGCEDEA